MDSITKLITEDGSVLITIIKNTDMVNKAITTHGLTPTTAAVLGRTLTIASFMSANLDADQRFSITIDGKGPIGKIVLAGKGAGSVKGYVENPSLDLPIRENDGKIDVGGAVGVDGYINVIKDLGLKEPYVGNIELVNGEIAEDFAYYFAKSEQKPTAIALGVLVDHSGCKSSGGIIIEPLPDCNDFVITMLEDILRNFKNISGLLYDKSVEEIIDEYFSIFNPKVFTPTVPSYECDCSKELIEKVIMALGKKEAYDILNDDKKIEVVCHFCNTAYKFVRADIDRIFGENSDN